MKKTKLVIQQAENGTYFTHESKGGHPDGKRNRRMFTGSTEDEVYFKATKWLKGIEEEERNPYTVREAMLQFIDSRSRVLEPTTLCCYREMLRNKLQYIMDIKIEDLTARDIQIAINVDAQRLGYKSIKNAVGFLRAVLNANDITIKMGSIRLPKKEVRERRLPSADVIYAIVKGTSSELPVLLAMWLSLRIGEVAGLQFCDIDPVQMRLYVRREIVKVDSGWAEIDHCKTVKSMRYVNLPAYIYALIQQVPHQSGTDHIVPFTPNTIRKRFKKLLEAHGLEEIRFHDLRHIFASTTAMLNIPEKYAMEMGGWSTPDVYKNVYQETFDSERNKADSVIDGYFNEIIQNH